MALLSLAAVSGEDLPDSEIAGGSDPVSFGFMGCEYKQEAQDTCRKADLVVIGGGACGIAVVAQVIERVKQGKKLRSVALIEKSKDVGPGLALRRVYRHYSQHATEHQGNLCG